MFKDKKIQFILIFIAVVAIASYCLGLFIDVTRDAGKYATISKEIFQNGSLINLTVNGEPYDQKPPLLFWLGALGFTIGGISNFWFKLPILLLVFAGIYWAFKLGESLYNKRVGFFTAFFLFFSLIVSMYSMDIHTDTPMQVFVTLALWQFSVFIKNKRTKNCLIGFIAVGLAMLTKGPFGAAIPGIAVIGHLLFTKQYKSFLDYRWYLGLLLSFVIVSPALIGLWNQFGWKGIHFFFIDNNIGRLTGNYVQVAWYDPSFYIHSLLYLFLPWSLLFYIAAFLDFRKLIVSRFKAPEFFTVFGIWIIFVILSSSKGQLPNYLFGIIPLMAVLLAKWIDIILNEMPKLAKALTVVQQVVVGLLWLFVVAITFYLFDNVPAWINIVALVCFAIIIGIYIKAKDQETKLLLPSAITMAFLMLLLNAHTFPYIFSFQAAPKAARYYNQNKVVDNQLYNYNYGQYELFFYSTPEAKKIHSHTELDSITGIKGSWIFTDKKGMDTISMHNLAPVDIIEYNHLGLNQGGLFINPKTRNKVLKPMYLLKF